MVTEKHFIFISLIIVAVVIPYSLLYIFEVKIIQIVLQGVLAAVVEPFIVLYALFVIVYWNKSTSAIKKLVKRIPLLNIPGLVLYWYFVIHNADAADGNDILIFFMDIMPIIFIVSLVWLYISVFIVLQLDKKIYHSI